MLAVTKRWGVEPCRVIVAGTRTFGDYDLLKRTMDEFTFWMDDVLVVSGGNKHRIGYNQWCGADFYGERWAFEPYNRYTVMRFHPDWDTHGRAAGPIRNREMADFAEYLVAFWDGVSAGTRDMIDVATAKGLYVHVVQYYEEG